jgi:hypothetical protein
MPRAEPTVSSDDSIDPEEGPDGRSGNGRDACDEQQAEPVTPPHGAADLACPGPEREQRGDREADGDDDSRPKRKKAKGASGTRPPNRAARNVMNPDSPGLRRSTTSTSSP